MKDDRVVSFNRPFREDPLFRDAMMQCNNVRDNYIPNRKREQAEWERADMKVLEKSIKEKK